MSLGHQHHVLCGVAEQQPLSDALTKACLQRFEVSQDARFLIPAIPGMQRPAVLQVSKPASFTAAW